MIKRLSFTLHIFNQSVKKKIMIVALKNIYYVDYNQFKNNFYEFTAYDVKNLKKSFQNILQFY